MRLGSVKTCYVIRVTRIVCVLFPAVTVTVCDRPAFGDIAGVQGAAVG